MTKFYRLYIDESGDHYYVDSNDPEKCFLCLLGCFFDLNYYENEFQPSFEKFKIRHFSRDVDDKVIVLHRKELINKQGHFSVLQNPEKEKAFNLELLKIMEAGKFGIIGVVIDKKSHKRKWGNIAAHPYHYCLLAIVQRFVGFLNYWNARGDVVAESRGGKEDMQLKSEFTHIYESGSSYVSANVFQKALSSKEIKLRKKEQNIAGLQVSDLFAHPCKQDVLLDNQRIDKYYGKFGKKLLKIAEAKYNRREINGQIKGYGKVFIK